MGKFTKTVYTGATTASIAREIANQAGLDGRIADHWDELGMKRSAARPHKVLITVTVERITAPRKARPIALTGTIERALRMVDAKRAVKPSPELGRALDSLLKGTR